MAFANLAFADSVADPAFADSTGEILAAASTSSVEVKGYLVCRRFPFEVCWSELMLPPTYHL